ncbi:MAG: TlpA disulfide reductase family protein [Chryseolinea sp.]
MKRIGLQILVAAVLMGCSAPPESPAALKTGIWRATIELQGQLLPFNIDVHKNASGKYEMFLKNAEENLVLDEVEIKDDSVDIVLHIFDANIKARIKGNELVGEFIKNNEKDYRVPFRAYYGQSYRFEKAKNQSNVPDFSGKYSVTFIHEADTTPAIGVFHQTGDSVTGTFLTPTGDYRYLQGNVVDGRLQVSTFDGNHSYLFYAVKRGDNRLAGEFYSGKTFKATWTGDRSDNPVMPDPEKLTYLKAGYDRLSFSFPNPDGEKISLADAKFKNKVVIIQLLGSWCPNCLDETLFLNQWIKKNKDRDVVMLGLAYERKDDFAYASGRVKKLILKTGVTYDILIAGTNDKARASATLPELQAVYAFPTTIFVGRDGKVKKIHTGFSGPGTGEYYRQFIEEFNETVNELLNEK